MNGHTLRHQFSSTAAGTEQETAHDRQDSRPKEAVTASTTWDAAVRPKRDSHIFCNGSELTIVPVAVPSAIRAPVAFASRNVSVSSPSSTASSSIATGKPAQFFELFPGAE